MGFIKHKPASSPSPADAADQENAKFLEQTLRKARKLMRPAKPALWAKQFAALRQLDGIDSGRIQKALEGYAKIIGGPYSPQAYSATAFRRKFVNIEEAVQRSESPAAKRKQVLDAVQVSDRAKQIASNLDYWGWPKGAKKDVPVLVQTCLDGFRQFRIKVTALADRQLKSWTVTRLAVHIRDSIAGGYSTAAGFTQWWVRGRFDMVNGWEAWSGNLKSLAWDGDPRHERFRVYAYATWIDNYLHDPPADIWDRFTEALE